jgi:hypothetical protein
MRSERPPKPSQQIDPMSDTNSSASSSEPTWLGLVRQKVEGLNYGVVQIVVHDHRVTQIERTEKTRIDPPLVGLRPRDEPHEIAFGPPTQSEVTSSRTGTHGT